MPILVILFTAGGGGVNYGHIGESISRMQWVATWDATGQLCNRTIWDHGGGHVALYISTRWTFIYLGFSTHYVGLRLTMKTWVLINAQEVLGHSPSRS